MTQRTKAIVRLLAVVVTWLNAILTAKGINPIPFDEGMVAEIIGYILASASSVWAWWKHTNWTLGAQVAYPDIRTINETENKQFGGEGNEMDPALLDGYEEPTEDEDDEEVEE